MRDAPDSESVPGYKAKPPGTREFTARAVIAGIVVAAIMGASYPYVVLKLGFGPNVSVVSAFFGYLALGIIFRNFNRWENNIVQTAGTSAAQTAFMCIILASFDLLKQVPGLGFTFSPTPFESFLWLSAASVLGLLLAVPLRRHYVVDEKLTYADGVAAAETIIVLDSRGPEARRPAMALGIGLAVSGALLFVQTPWGGTLVPEVIWPTLFGLTFATAGAGLAIDLLSVGSGIIIGFRITTGMLIGTLLSWVIAPHFLVEYNLVASASRNDLLRWVMWPGISMIICAGLTALALKWSTLVRTFRNLAGGSIGSDEFPMRWVVIGVVLSTIALVIIQIQVFGLDWWMPLAAVVLSLPLMLVGLRALGETNWGPISQMTNLMQVIFGALSPRNLVVNIATSGTTGTIAVQSEAIMQDYKAGHILGSTPRYLTYAQLMAAPIGAAAVSWMYPLLAKTYGVGADGLSSPISVRIATLAEFLARGGDAMPPFAMEAAIVFGALGVLITLFEKRYRFLPSPTAVGIGMVITGSVIITIFIGGLIGMFWERRDPQSSHRMAVPLASGLIAGAAIVAVLIPLLVAIGLLPMPGKH